MACLVSPSFLQTSPLSSQTRTWISSSQQELEVPFPTGFLGLPSEVPSLPSPTPYSGRLGAVKRETWRKRRFQAPGQRSGLPGATQEGRACWAAQKSCSFVQTQPVPCQRAGCGVRNVRTCSSPGVPQGSPGRAGAAAGACSEIPAWISDLSLQRLDVV